MPVLKGMTWDHIRGIAPVEAAAAEFSKRDPSVRIEWHVRSLEAFEDYPVERIAADHDLMMIDHPFIGEGVEKGVLEPCDGWLPADFLADQKKNSVGPGYDTYHWQGRQWALAVDVAAQVSALRRDLLGTVTPRSFDEVFALARDLPAGRRMALPLVPTHAFASFTTLSANIGGNGFFDPVAGIDERAALPALDLLARLAAAADPRSFTMNPIHMLDAMAGGDEIVYSPLIYGYSNYARAGWAAHLVHFADIPSTVTEPRGSQIGGVGLAVSAHSRHKEEAMRYARFVAGAECQAGLFYASGGQPGHRAAWVDPAIDRDCNGFFADTLRTLDLASVRPRLPGFNRFQETAGHLIHGWLRERGDPRSLVGDLNRLYTDEVSRRVREKTLSA
jgi:multiple sugar transport system substrate-binding protein